MSFKLKQLRWRLSALAFLALPAFSCSVKEDRSGCPSTMVLVFSDLPSVPVTVLVSGASFREEVLVKGDTLVTMTVPKSGVTV